MQDGGRGQGELELVFGVRMIPHPKKAHTGGEDAFFISSNRKAFGVADGVMHSKY